MCVLSLFLGSLVSGEASCHVVSEQTHEEVHVMLQGTNPLKGSPQEELKSANSHVSMFRSRSFGPSLVLRPLQSQLAA